mgnify:CR=1 FL=1
MAIPKKVTFEGNTYHLGNKDRVSAYASLTNSPVIVTAQYNSASLTGMTELGGGYGGVTQSLFYADRNYKIEAANFVPTITSSAEASVINLTYGSSAGGGTRVFSSGIGRMGGAAHTATTESVANVDITAGNQLAVVATNANAKGVVTVVLSPKSPGDYGS